MESNTPESSIGAVDSPAPEVGFFELLKAALRGYHFLGPTDILKLLAIIRFKRTKKGDHLIRIGELNHNVILVLKGLLRTYVLDGDGKDRTMLFIPAKKSAGSYQTILRNLPSIEGVVTLEDSLVAIVDFRKFEELARQSPALLLYQNTVLKELLGSAVDHVWTHVVLTPEQRYHRFCLEFPKLEQRVPLKHLASYLGINATSLSRIRSRMVQRSQTKLP